MLSLRRNGPGSTTCPFVETLVCMVRQSYISNQGHSCLSHVSSTHGAPRFTSSSEQFASRFRAETRAVVRLSTHAPVFLPGQQIPGRLRCSRHQCSRCAASGCLRCHSL